MSFDEDQTEKRGPHDRCQFEIEQLEAKLKIAEDKLLLQDRLFEKSVVVPTNEYAQKCQALTIATEAIERIYRWSDDLSNGCYGRSQDMEAFAGKVYDQLK